MSHVLAHTACMAEAFPLSFEDQGAGAPLILVHGMAGDRRTWDGVFDALALRCRVIRYDLRGFGQSHDTPHTPYSHTGDLLALMDHLNLDASDVLGVSMGGSIALNFALEHPERMRRLILVSPSLKGWDWSDAWRALEAEIERVAREQGVDAARAAWLRHPLFETLPKDARASLAAEVANYSGRHWLRADLHTPLLRADIERLDQLSAPTLLITGARDMPDMRLIADALTAIAPDIKRMDVSDAGHLVHRERASAFLAAVERFLT